MYIACSFTKAYCFVVSAFCLVFALATIIYVLQTTVGIINLPGGMLIDAYPVSLRWFDFPIVALTVISIGGLAAILPARRARRVEAVIQSE